MYLNNLKYKAFIKYFVELTAFVKQICIFQEQSREDCSGPPKYCVPKETCINGNIDTSAGPLLNKCSLANSISKCKQNEVCCQYGGQVRGVLSIYTIYIVTSQSQTLPYDWS